MYIKKSVKSWAVRILDNLLTIKKLSYITIPKEVVKTLKKLPIK